MWSVKGSNSVKGAHNEAMIGWEEVVVRSIVDWRDVCIQSWGLVLMSKNTFFSLRCQFEIMQRGLKANDTIFSAMSSDHFLNSVQSSG